MRRSFTGMTDTEKAAFIREQAEELELYATNTAELYEERKKIQRGGVRRADMEHGDMLAYHYMASRYVRWYKHAADRYNREIETDDGPTWFPVDSIRMAAHSTADADMAEIKLGNLATI